MRFIAIVSATVVLQGCDPFVVACTDELRYAVSITVREYTGGGLSSTPTGTLIDGDYRETMEVHYAESWDAHVLEGGGFRAGGPYDIEVRAEGYRTWNLEDVSVKMNEKCDKPAQTLPLEARMFPLHLGG